MASSADWLSYRDALARMLECCEFLDARSLPVDDSLGFAVAADVRSRVDHPPWDNSAMDGFAVRSEDLEDISAGHPVTLTISDDVPAGSFPQGPLRAGTAVKVMTGAPVPSGATGVIRIEHTNGGTGGIGGSVEIRDGSDALRNIRRRGEDVRTGAVVLGRGDQITPAAIGVLTLTGHARVEVGRRPKIAVLATGDELVGLDGIEEVIAGRKIMNSNSHALAAQLRTAGAEPVPLGIARDDQADIVSRLKRGLACDGIVSTAGVSVGEHDRVKQALDELGMERIFWRASIRPGSPIAFGLLAGKPFWALPGNPVSAMVTFEVFVRPGVRKMAGHAQLEERSVARVGERIDSTANLTHFFRVRLEQPTDDLPAAYLTGPQGSGILTSMSAADALLIVPEGVERLEPGAVAETIAIGPTAHSATAPRATPGAGNASR